MAGAIPLYQAPDTAGYRLLELPQELVDLIEGDNAPATIQLKPSPTAAVLITPKRNYSLRQRNTSNGLILLRPGPAVDPPSSSSSSNSNTNPDTIMTDDDNNRDKQADNQPKAPSLYAFATLHETIELEPLEDGQEVPPPPKMGKWHEKLARHR